VAVFSCFMSLVQIFSKHAYLYIMNSDAYNGISNPMDSNSKIRVLLNT